LKKSYDEADNDEMGISIEDTNIDGLKMDAQINNFE
jgi:hypothetical protein